MELCESEWSSLRVRMKLIASQNGAHCESEWSSLRVRMKLIASQNGAHCESEWSSLRVRMKLIKQINENYTSGYSNDGVWHSQLDRSVNYYNTSTVNCVVL